MNVPLPLPHSRKMLQGIARRFAQAAGGGIVAAIVLTASPGTAQSYTWNSSSSTDWNTAANWQGGGVPDSNTESAVFGAATGLANPVLGSATTIQGLSFSSASTPGYVFSGGDLTIDTNINAVGTAITQASANLETFNQNVTLTDAAHLAQSITLNLSGTGGVKFGAGYTVTMNDVLSIQGAGNVTFNGGLALGSSGLQLNFGGTGTYYFNPTSTSNNVRVRVTNTGLLNIGSNYTSGDLEMGASSGTASMGTAYLTTNGMTFTQAIAFGSVGTSTGGTVGFGSNVGGGGTTTASGNITMETASGSTMVHQFYAGSGNTLNITGAVVGGTSTGAVQITGPGVVNLAKAIGNSYVAPTTIVSGTMLAGNTSGSATGTGAVTIASGARLGGAGFISGAVTAAAADSVIAPGAIGSIGTLTLSGGLTATSGLTFQIDMNGTTATDLLKLGGGAFNASGGTLLFDVSDLGGASVTAGTAYTLISGTGVWSAPSSVQFDLPTGWVLDTSYNGTGYAFDTTNDTFTVRFASVVPEPSTAMLALVGLGGTVLLASFRRGRTAATL